MPSKINKTAMVTGTPALLLGTLAQLVSPWYFFQNDIARTFWDLQQNQDIHKEAEWQDKMVEIEMRVSDMDEYKDVAFFHHLMIEKR